MPLYVCPHCNYQTQRNEPFCCKCGTKMASVVKTFCKACGKELPPYDEFCTRCGAKRNTTKAQSTYSKYGCLFLSLGMTASMVLSFPQYQGRYFKKHDPAPTFQMLTIPQKTSGEASGITQIRARPSLSGTANPGQQEPTAAEMSDYCKRLADFISPKWNTFSPSADELGDGVPSWPVVELSIAKDGRVTKAVIVSASGNRKLDDAVRVLLADLTAVPAPPRATSIRITLDIR